MTKAIGPDSSSRESGPVAVLFVWQNLAALSTFQLVRGTRWCKALRASGCLECLGYCCLIAWVCNGGEGICGVVKHCVFVAFANVDDGQGYVLGFGFVEYLFECGIIHVLRGARGDEEDLSVLASTSSLLRGIRQRGSDCTTGLGNTTGTELLNRKRHWAGLAEANVLAVSHCGGLEIGEE